MRYLKRIYSIIYFYLNSNLFKYLDFHSFIASSTRVEGKKYISIGRNSSVQSYGWLLGLKINEEDPILTIGQNCSIGMFSHIVSVKNVQIDNDVLIANNVYISDNLHSYERIDIPIINQEIQFKGEVFIKEGAWIGENVCIIGASVGRNSIIGANSVVTRDVPDFCVAVGSPAKVIKKFDFESRRWCPIDN